jgi:hemolysin activation/secretion protein
MLKNISRIAIISSNLLCALPIMAAPVAPDAGQTIRELQQQPDLSVPKTTPQLQPEEPAVPKTPPIDDVRMMVKSIHVSGNSMIATGELDALLTDLVGSEHTLAELNEGASRITAYYHERGYIVTRAYIPAQKIKDGAVMFSVQEGIVGDQRINNQSRLSDQRTHDYLSGIKSGDVLRVAPVERALLLLNEMPGVGAARAALQPGASAGSSDIVVELTPSAPYAVNIEMDNNGNYYTGENRLGAELVINSPLRIGDQVTLRALTSEQDLTYAYIAYQIPVGGNGLRLGGAYSATGFRLGKELAASQTHGNANIASLFAVYPFIRSQKSNLSGIFTMEDKQLKDVVSTIFSDKNVQAGSLGLVGNHRDSLGGAGITLFDLSLATGRLSLDTASLSYDNLSAHTDGAFTRFSYDLNRQQLLSDSYSLSLALSGQFANKNLNSSEQFSLGGANGVRAYPQGEAYGDEGRLATVELRHSFSQTLQGVIFYDAGTVIINHNPYLAGSNTRFLSGAGAGVNTTLAGVQIKAYLALRASGGRPASEPATINSEYRFWLQLGKQF